jgi:hypothetical protein
MTEQVQNDSVNTMAESEETSAQQVPPAQLSPQQIKQIKASLLERLQKQYLEFLGNIANMPCYKPAQLEGFRFFDTGFLWCKSAIENLSLEPPAPVAPASSITQPETPEAA